MTKTDTGTLDQLETRFFEHTYPKDDDETRIERLEKLVFGEAKQGNEDERVAALMASLPKDDPAAAGSSSDSGSASSGDSSSSSSSSGSDNSSQDASSGTGQQTASGGGDGEDYPKVDALEQLILGKTFQNEAISRRLDQLELKAFKQTSSNPDLSDRVSRLEEYVQKHMHRSVDAMVDPRNIYHYNSPNDGGDDNVRAPAYTGSPYGSNTAYGNSGGSYGGGPYGGGAPSYGGGSGSYGTGQNLAGAATQNDYWTPPPATTPDAVQVAWLETRVFGQSFPTTPMIERLRKLEAAVFPAEATETTASISMQIKVLVNAVELMHTSNPQQTVLAAGETGQQPMTQPGTASGTGSNFPSWPPQGANNNQYSSYSANAQGTTPGAYPYQTGYAGDNNQQYSQQMQNVPPAQQASQPPEHHGHPFLKSLAHTLLQVGSMAASSAMMSGMYGGYGGMGGMMPGYGMPGMGMGMW